MGKCNRNIPLAPFKRGNVVTKKVKETSSFTHTQLSLATSLRGKLWRVVYWVSPRTPEGGQAGKADTPPFLHIPSCRWLPSKGELGRKTYSFKGGM